VIIVITVGVKKHSQQPPVRPRIAEICWWISGVVAPGYFPVFIVGSPRGFKVSPMTISSSGSKEKVFYGWWIVITCSCLSIYGSGIFYYGFGTFVKPVIAELGWSMAMISGAFSFYRLEAGIAAPIVGFLLDRFGPRRLVLIGGIVMGSGFIFLSQVSTVLPFYSAVVIISMGWSACVGSSVGTPLVGKWFVKKRGRALGIYGAVRGLAGLLVPAVAYLIVQYGWRSALIILGILSWFVILPLSFALRDSPETCGLLPDGEPSRCDIQQGDSRAERSEAIEADFPLRKAMRSRTFWIITLCLFSHQATQSAVFVHIVPYLVDVGIEPTLAASVVTFMSLVSVFGRYGSGWLGDLFNKKWLLFVLYLLQPIGLFSLLQVHNFMEIIPFVLVYSTAYGGNSVVKAAIVGDYFGRKNFGTIYGAIQGLSIAGSILGPLMAGLVYDINGSYTLAFTALGVMMIFPALLVLLLKAPSRAT
jgi:MFS family permease